MPAPPRTEKMDPARLMAAIHGNDPAAFRELYRRYLPSLRYGVRAFTRKCTRLQRHEEEIVSKAWVRLLARHRKLLRSYDPRRASFGTFMAMVGANTAWQLAVLKPQPDHDWRDAHEDELVAGLPSESDIEAIAADRELLARLSERIRAALSERELRLLEDAIIWQRPATELAEALGISVEAVWAATSRLRKKLEELAGDLTTDSPQPLRAVRSTVEALMLALMLTTAHEEPCPAASTMPLRLAGGDR